LGDKSAEVRTRAAKLCGEYRVADADAPLAAMLLGDSAAPARKAAAWALGRIGASEGASALIEADQSERDPRVRDAIDVALRMK
jgi:HEAT repeat protein